MKKNFQMHLKIWFILAKKQKDYVKKERIRCLKQ